jgi:hypothetical protein
LWLGGGRGVEVEVGIAGGEVMLCGCVVVVASLHPQIYPGVLQVAELEGAGVEPGDVEVGSLQPNQPGVVQVVVEVSFAVLVLVWGLVVVVSSLQPNHPGVLQVDVVVVVVVLVEVTGLVVVVSSKHPHQPGVWQVDVRVLVFVEEDDDEVDDSVLLPVTSFQSGQS